jgi:hypothetical protein
MLNLMKRKGREDDCAIVVWLNTNTVVAFPENQRTTGELLGKLLKIVYNRNKTVSYVVPSGVLVLFVKLPIAISGYHRLLPGRIVDDIKNVITLVP